MANPRRKNRNAATLLTIVMLGAALWFATDWTDEAAPRAQTRPESVDSAANAADGTPGTSRAAVADHAATEPAREPEYTSDTSSARAGPAIVEVHVHFADPAAARDVELRAIGEASRAVVARGRCAARGVEAVGEIEVPTHQWNHIEASIDDMQIPGRRLHLGPGERYRIDLDCAAAVTRLRIQGPTRELLRHLRLEVTDRGADPPIPFYLPLDEDGAVACALSGPALAHVTLSGRHQTHHFVPLRTHGGSFEINTSLREISLVPDERLLGIVARHRGRLVPAAMRLDHSSLAREPTACNVTTMTVGRRAESIQVTTAARGHHRGPMDRVRRQGDVWTVDLEDLDRLGELRVTFGAGELTAPTAPLVAIARQGGETAQLDDTRDPKVRLTRLLAGDYRLAWAPPGAPLETAVELVRVEAGEITELELAPRLLETWTIELAGAPQNLPLTLWQGQHIMASGVGGTLTGSLGRAPAPGEPASIVLTRERSAFGATFVAVDPLANRAEITSTLTRATQTKLTPTQLRRGHPRVWLLPTSTMPPTGGVLRSESLHVLPGQKRRGYVVENLDGDEQLTCWFEVDAGTAELVLSPSGRWVSLTLPRAPVLAVVLHDSAHGSSKSLQVPASGLSVPVYVAEGTTAVHVTIGGIRKTFDARLNEFVFRE